MLQQDIENRKKQEKRKRAKAAQQVDSDSSDSGDMLDNFTEKFKDKFSGLFGSKKAKTNPKELQRLANEQFVRENI